MGRHEAIANCADSPCRACDCFVPTHDAFYMSFPPSQSADFIPRNDMVDLSWVTFEGSILRHAFSPCKFANSCYVSTHDVLYFTQTLALNAGEDSPGEASPVTLSSPAVERGVFDS
ncbi:hypothetical protein FHS10_002851 [Mucilaginibacter dorajii]|nr:hypothetical protein [Mucilaginibacter dorajii]